MYVWYVRSPEWSLSPPMTIPRGAQNGKIEGNNIWYSYAHIDGDGKTWTVAANANTPFVINDNMKQIRFWVQMEIVCSHVWISNQTIWMTDQNVERIEWNNWTLKTCITWEWEVICFCFFFAEHAHWWMRDYCAETNKKISHGIGSDRIIVIGFYTFVCRTQYNQIGAVNVACESFSIINQKSTTAQRWEQSTSIRV